jgi:acetoin utilization deacetylase AcuC-like enzyme
MPAGRYWRHPSSLEHDTGAHPENRARIPAIEGELERRGWLGWQTAEAPEVALEVVERVHPREYVERIRAFAETGGGHVDADTIVSAGSWKAALHAAGGAVAMVDALLADRDRPGFSALRPPGHHAEAAGAMGFCLLNNVAIAARHALDDLGAARVLVFDWDVHHGNGTNDIFHSSPEVLYVSIHQSPLYPGTGPPADTGSGAGEGYTVNLPVPPGAGEPVWLSLVEHLIVPVARSFEPDLVLVSAGFDGHRADPLAQCLLETESFAQMAAHLRVLAAELGVPRGAVLEGGYDLDALAASVAATLEAFGDSAEPRGVERDELTRAASERLASYWPVLAG